MRVQTISTSGISAAVAPLDVNISPFEVALAALVTGTATFTVNVSFDPIAAGPTTWFPVAALTGKTANTLGFLSANNNGPATFVQLNQTAGAGSVILEIIQSGISGQ